MKLLLPVLLPSICAVLTLPSVASTIAVGNCDPQHTSYATISEAVAAAPPGATVLVCPGTYPEQVTITTSLTLRGILPSSPPVLRPPSGGLTGAQINVNGEFDSSPLAVNLGNLVVDGLGSSPTAGVSYNSASGQLNHLEVRNQTTGIFLVGAIDGPIATVNISNSYVHNFSNEGISANGLDVEFVVNITRSFVTSTSASVQNGISYNITNGTIRQNAIILKAGVGLLLDNLFDPITAEGNAIEGASVGIESGADMTAAANVIENNVLYNNATGISISGLGGGDTITSNTIMQSSIQAITLNCSATSIAQYNKIDGTPIGIANIQMGDVTSPNTFTNVGTDTTECPSGQ
jgi:Protein of unknown function (DUF1565)